MSKYSLTAGAARGDITPSEGLFPIPFLMTYNMPAAADRIHLRVLDLDNGVNRVLFITFDMVTVPHPDETMKLVCDYTGLSRANVFLVATHTHEVPIIGFEGLTLGDGADKKRLWYDEVKKTLLDAIRRAGESRRPARIGYSHGKSYININRDEVVNGNGKIGNNFERPSDKTLALVRLEDMEGRPIALIVNYAVHAVVMNGCIVDGSILISGDLPGRTSTELEQQLDGAVVLWTSGAAGDQNPRIMTQYVTETADSGKSVTSLGKTGYMILDYLTREHVRDILAVNKTVLCDACEAEIFAAERIAVCPGRIRPKDSAVGTQASDVSITLRLLTVGDLAFEGISAEVVTSIGTALKQASPFGKTMVVTHVNNYCGYIPDDWGYDNNTFEAGGTFVKKGTAQPAFINGFADMFREKGV